MKMDFGMAKSINKPIGCIIYRKQIVFVLWYWKAHSKFHVHSAMAEVDIPVGFLERGVQICKGEFVFLVISNFFENFPTKIKEFDFKGGFRRTP